MMYVCASILFLFCASFVSADKTGRFADLVTKDELKELRKKRVRRPVRSLNPSEWNRITEAMNVMKYTTTEKGQEIYGPNYRSYDWFVCQHARSASAVVGDLSHFGPHFLLWHHSFTNYFEKVLRLIDPVIKAAPYILWTEDEANGVPHDERTIFDPEWFGGASGTPENGFYAIPDGPFAGWPVENKYTSEEVCVEPEANGADYVHNLYGYLRKPVNVNPSPFVTRAGNNICGNAHPCEVLLEHCFEEPSIALFDKCQDFPHHGFQHRCIGGNFPRYPGQPQTQLCDTGNFIFGANIPAGLRMDASHPYFECVECPESCEYDPDANGGYPDPNCVCHPIGDICTFKGAGFRDMSYVNVELTGMIGDMYDLWAGPNEPMFMFAHTGVDRWLHRYLLQNRHLKESNYGFPDSPTLMVGLSKIMHPAETWMGLYTEELGYEGPYTYYDVLQATDLWAQDYTYDYILDLVHQ